MEWGWGRDWIAISGRDWKNGLGPYHSGVQWAILRC